MKFKHILVSILLCFTMFCSAALSGCTLGISGGDNATYTLQIERNENGTYYEGDEFSLDNYTLTLVNDQDGTTKNIDLTKATITLPDMNTAGEKQVSIKYNGKTYTFTVDVKSTAEKYEMIYGQITQFLNDYMANQHNNNLTINLDGNISAKYLGDVATQTFDNELLVDTANLGLDGDRLYDFVYKTLIDNILKSSLNLANQQVENSDGYKFAFDLFGTLFDIYKDLQKFDYYDYIMKDVLFTQPVTYYVDYAMGYISEYAEIEEDSVGYNKLYSLLNTNLSKLINHQDNDWNKVLVDFLTLLKTYSNNDALQPISDIALDQINGTNDAIWSKIFKLFMTATTTVWYSDACVNVGPTVVFMPTTPGQYVLVRVNGYLHYFVKMDDGSIYHICDIVENEEHWQYWDYPVEYDEYLDGSAEYYLIYEDDYEEDDEELEQDELTSEQIHEYTHRYIVGTTEIVALVEKLVRFGWESFEDGEFKARVENICANYEAMMELKGNHSLWVSSVAPNIYPTFYALFKNYDEDLKVFIANIIRNSQTDATIIYTLFNYVLNCHLNFDKCQTIADTIWDAILNDKPNYEEDITNVLVTIFDINQNMAREYAQLILEEIEQPEFSIVSKCIEVYYRNIFHIFQYGQEIQGAEVDQIIYRVAQYRSKEIRLIEDMFYSAICGTFDVDFVVGYLKEYLQENIDICQTIKNNEYEICIIREDVDYKTTLIIQSDFFEMVSYDIVCMYEGDLYDTAIKVARKYGSLEQLILTLTETRYSYPDNEGQMHYGSSNILAQEDISKIANFVYDLLEGKEVDYQTFIIDVAKMFGMCDESQVAQYIQEFKENGYTTVFSDFLNSDKIQNGEIKLLNDDTYNAMFIEELTQLVVMFEQLPIYPLDKDAVANSLVNISQILSTDDGVDFYIPVAIEFIASIVDGSYPEFIKDRYLIELALYASGAQVDEEEINYISNFVYTLLKNEEVDYVEFIFKMAKIIGLCAEKDVAYYIEEYKNYGYSSILSDYLDSIQNSPEYAEEKANLVALVRYLERIPANGFDADTFIELVYNLYESVPSHDTYMLLGGELAYAIYKDEFVSLLRKYYIVEMAVAYCVMNTVGYIDYQPIVNYIYDVLEGNEIDYEEYLAYVISLVANVSQEDAQKYIDQFQEHGYITFLSDYVQNNQGIVAEKLQEEFVNFVKAIEKAPSDEFSYAEVIEATNAYFAKLLVANIYNTPVEVFIYELGEVLTRVGFEPELIAKDLATFYQADIQNLATDLVADMLGIKSNRIGYLAVKSLVFRAVDDYLNDEFDAQYVYTELQNIIDTYCEEDVKVYAKSIETLILVLFGDQEEIDYNDLFAFVELPPAVESIDYNVLVAKLAEGQTYENIFKLKDATTEFVKDQNGNIVSEILTVKVDIDFDVMLAGINGELTFNFAINF